MLRLDRSRAVCSFEPLPPFLDNPWGKRSIRLRLPGTCFHFDGLNTRQYQEIHSDYGAFVDQPERLDEAPDVMCSARSLGWAIALPAESFSHNGDYVPHKTYNEDRIQIVGHDFIARIRFDHFPVSAELAVAKSDELTRFTIENFLRILVAYRALELAGLLLHSFGVVASGRVLLFVGRSGAGKTTLARKADSAGFRVLSDDINMLLPRKDGYHEGYLVHAVPFTGEFGRRADMAPGAIPLGGILLLEQASALAVDRVSPSQAVSKLLAGSPFVNDDEEQFPRLMETIIRLVGYVPVASLRVARDDDFSNILCAVEEGLLNGR